jgi:hypothetical protein
MVTYLEKLQIMLLNYVAKLCNIIGNLESIHLESIVKRIYKHFNIEL